MNWTKHFLYCKGTHRGRDQRHARRLRAFDRRFDGLLDGKLGFRVAAAHREA